MVVGGDKEDSEEHSTNDSLASSDECSWLRESCAVSFADVDLADLDIVSWEVASAYAHSVL